jgi:hypothetical protein
MGGVNHCSLHCHLAKFRGLMTNAKHGAVIGWKPRAFACTQSELPGYGSPPANHSAVFCIDHQINHRILLDDSVNYSG